MAQNPYRKYEKRLRRVKNEDTFCPQAEAPPKYGKDVRNDVTSEAPR